MIDYPKDRENLKKAFKKIVSDPAFEASVAKVRYILEPRIGKIKSKKRNKSFILNLTHKEKQAILFALLREIDHGEGSKHYKSAYAKIEKLSIK